MKVVYLVNIAYNYEGIDGDSMRIFSTKDLAEAYKLELSKESQGMYAQVYITPFKIDEA